MLNQLKNLGLSDKAARVYLAMLELGPATMLQIAAKAEVNRPTVYVQIESLKKLGLVSTQTKGKKQLFMAEGPEQLERLIEKENREIEYKKEELAKVLPELGALFHLAGEKPQVRFFEGKEGLLRMQEDLLTKKSKEVWGISAIDDVFALFPDHKERYSTRRIKKKIKSKLIYTSAQGKIYPEYDKTMLMHTHYIPPKKLPLTVDIGIYDDTIGIASLKGKISGTLIQHTGIANSFRSIFNLLWGLAKK